MKYLKKFENHSQYESYIQGGGVALPNVSLCEENNDVHYNPIVPETKLVVYYDIQDISAPTTICTNYDSSIKSIEVDGVLLDSVVTTYQFGSVGEHIIKYEFNNPTTVGNSAPLFYNLTTIKRAVIADTFTSIGDNAFTSCMGLTSVTIGNGVTNIGNAVFGGCSGITSVTIGNGVTSIGGSAFDSCTSLTSIDIPDNVTSIGSGAFQNCSGLTSVTIPSGVTSIGDNAFQNCSNMTNVTIGNGVTSIGGFAFQNCSNMTNVTIGNGVTTIGMSAFNKCSGLTSVTIPNSVTSIGEGTFSSCSGLQTIISLATTAPSVSNRTFQNIKTGGTLYVPIGSSGYNTWMSTGDYYLGSYNWTKVEQ